MKNPRFHAKDNWYFERLKGGYVKIAWQPALPLTIGQTLELDPDAWASIVAHVSMRGDTAASFQEALNFHNKQASDVRDSDNWDSIGFGEPQG